MRIVSLTGLSPAVLCFVLLRQSGILAYGAIGAETIIYLVFFYLPFAAMAVAFLDRRRNGLSPPRSLPIAPLALMGLFAVSTLHLLLAIYDAVFLRNVLDVGITEARYTAMLEGPRNSMIGGITYLLSGAAIVLGAIYVMAVRQGFRLSRLYRIGIPSIVVGSFAVSFLSGGRNTFLISCIFLGAVFVLSKTNLPPQPQRRRRKRMSFKVKMLAAAVIMAGAGWSFWLFAARSVTRGESVGAALLYFNSHYAAMNMPETNNETLYAIYYSIGQMVFYLTHQAAYLNDYIAGSYCPATMGASSLFGFFRVIDFVLGTEMSNYAIHSLVVRGVYLSFPGQLYVDFCGYGAVFGVILAVFGFVVTRRALAGESRYVFIAAYVLTLLALSPIYSVPANGNGFSLLLFSFGATYIVGLKASRKRGNPAAFRQPHYPRP